MSPLALSLLVATASTLLAAVVGLAMATLLATKRFPGRALLDVLVTVPMVMPPTVLGYYLLVLLGRRGPIGQAFEALTGSTIVFTRTGAVVAAAVGALPIVIKSGRAALEDVDPRLVFAARTLGASSWRAFLTVRLPLAARGIVAALMLAFARALGDFGVTLMVAGNIPGETQTASLAIFDAILAQRDEDALSLVIVLTLVATAVLYSVNKLTERRRT
ncbi:molybdate ABC transporter permease subunit [Pendulispora brunnea]|uniref:Molybdenum transport system permease n=1 Tax=Pendulispora brunnea TaxID=2905690 RepID=A0ABZ2KKS8_9BACT